LAPNDPNRCRELVTKLYDKPGDILRTDIPLAEFPERQARAAELARQRGFAGLVVWSRNATTADWYGDVQYLTNHHTAYCQLPDHLPYWSGKSHSVLILPVDGDPVLVIDTAEYREELETIEDIRIDLNIPLAVGKALKEIGLVGRPLGLCGRESLLLSSYKLLLEQTGDRLDVRPADDLVAAMRSIKSPTELNVIRTAAQVGITAMNRIMSAVEPGRTEAEIAGIGWNAMVSQGGFPYDIAITSGPHSAQFQWAGLPSADHIRKLEAGDLFHVDLWGPAVRGYWTDFVRSTVAGGAPTDAQKEVLDGSIGLVHAVMEHVRPGATFGELWRAGDTWQRENGFAPADGNGAPGLREMLPGFGHCYGMGCEGPYIMEGATEVVAEGMVVAVETLLVRDGVGGAGYEQDMIVTADGIECITAPCRDRWW
jgi:Xaa-Pro aminopeptidase